jgi:hypothetical protein
MRLPFLRTRTMKKKAAIATFGILGLVVFLLLAKSPSSYQGSWFSPLTKEQQFYRKKKQSRRQPE